MTGLILPAIVTSLRTLKDGSISILFETQELSPAKCGEVFSYRGKLVALYLSPKETIPQKEMDQVDQIDVDLPGKTKSQRVRNVLYRIWELQSDGHKTFESYYNSKMEEHINSLKQYLDSLI